MTTTVADRIERSIDIDAPADRVWGLVSTPGWWINDGTVTDNTVEDRGDHVVVRNAEHGEFRVVVVVLDPPSAAAFRWSSGNRDDGTQPTTLVEFAIEPRPGGGVTLTVVESGFAGLSPDRRESTYRDNDEGWASELAAARMFLTTAP